MKKITKSRIITLALSLVFLLSAATTCFAETRVLEEFENNSPDSGIEILWDKNAKITVDLAYKKGVFQISMLATNQNAKDKITGEVKLEKKSGRRWTEVKSWKVSDKGACSFSGQYKTNETGSYRVKAVISDGNSKATGTSDTISI